MNLPNPERTRKQDGFVIKLNDFRRGWGKDRKPFLWFTSISPEPINTYIFSRSFYLAYLVKKTPRHLKKHTTSHKTMNPQGNNDTDGQSKLNSRKLVTDSNCKMMTSNKENKFQNYKKRSGGLLSANGTLPTGVQ